MSEKTKTCRKMTNDNKDVRKLNRQLQRFARRTDIKAKMAKMGPHVAESEKEGNRVRMKIDPDTAPKIQSYIHELLHWLWEKETSTTPYSIHERWILASETQLWEFISGDKRRVNWWRREVNYYTRKRG